VKENTPLIFLAGVLNVLALDLENLLSPAVTSCRLKKKIRHRFDGELSLKLYGCIGGN